MMMSEEEYQKNWDDLRTMVDQLLHDLSGSLVVSFEEMYRNESIHHFHTMALGSVSTHYSARCLKMGILII